MAAILFLLFMNVCVEAQENPADPSASQPTAVEEMAKNAESVLPLVESELATSFLKTAQHLPEVASFTVYIRESEKETKNPVGISIKHWETLPEEEQQGYIPRTVSGMKYYFTKYGSPIAFVRAVELAGQAGLTDFENKKIVDFGFGSIGHLRMMAMRGAAVHGVDVDLFLQSLYRRPRDQGEVSIGDVAGLKAGSVKLSFGKFPGEEAVAKEIGGEIDLFVSKNTLKRGYIHPAQKVDPRRMIDLGVSDQEFVGEVYSRLQPGGLFLIYNLHPRRTEPGEKYITWSDGRCPFEQKLLTDTGFEIVAFDQDDTEFAHAMATAFGWDKQMDLDENFRATYTLLKKK